MSNQWPQLRPEKSSLYMPAVLRPNFPPRRVSHTPDPTVSPLISPSGSSSGSSSNSSNASWWGESTTENMMNNHETEYKIPSIPALGLEGLGEVTGPPTRVHWKPDIFSSHCDQSSTLCTRNFTIFRRRHHCRRCGLIFCHLHSLHKVPLDQDANFHPYGTQVRACESCWLQWVKWVEKHSANAADMGTSNARVMLGHINSVTSPLDVSSVTDNSIHYAKDYVKGAMVTSLSLKDDDFEPSLVEVEDMSQSVPRDWHWSTF